MFGWEHYLSVSKNIFIKIILLAQEPNAAFSGVKSQGAQDVSRRHYSWTACVFHIGFRSASKICDMQC